LRSGLGLSSRLGTVMENPRLSPFSAVFKTISPLYPLRLNAVVKCFFSDSMELESHIL
jgi:hypothetical protein